MTLLLSVLSQPDLPNLPAPKGEDIGWGDVLSEPPLKALYLTLWKVYRATVSSAQGEVCNYEPSCSVFGAKAVKRYGLIKGLLLSSDRLQRCHPWTWRYLRWYWGAVYVEGRGVKIYDPVEDYGW